MRIAFVLLGVLGLAGAIALGIPARQVAMAVGMGCLFGLRR